MIILVRQDRMLMMLTLLQRYIAGESVLTDDAVKAADF